MKEIYLLMLAILYKTLAIHKEESPCNPDLLSDFPALGHINIILYK